MNWVVGRFECNGSVNSLIEYCNSLSIYLPLFGHCMLLKNAICYKIYNVFYNGTIELLEFGAKRLAVLRYLLRLQKQVDGDGFFIVSCLK